MTNDESPLSSPAIGTGRNDLITGCEPWQPSYLPPAPPRQPPIALAFSGGGFRATLSCLGVLRFVADAGLLGQVRWVSSVSGGSVAHGLFAHAYKDLEASGFTSEALDELVVRPLVDRVTGTSLVQTLVGGLWRIVGPRTRTTLLADTFDEWFFGGLLLEDLSPTCRFIFNASNLTTGVRFGFERHAVGDWVMGQVPTEGTRLRVADAVAASAAFPGGFAPVVLRGFPFPCANGRIAKLLDGGAYDNMGLEPLDDLNALEDENLRDACLVALNAGGVFRTGTYGRIPLVRDLMRANSLLYRQSTGLRMRAMIERFRAWEQTPAGTAKPSHARRGVLFGLATTIAADAAQEWREGRPEQDENTRRDLALTETSFNRFDPQVCEQLLYRGWWLAGATLSEYHRDVLPAELPAWRPLIASTATGP